MLNSIVSLIETVFSKSKVFVYVIIGGILLSEIVVLLMPSFGNSRFEIIRTEWQPYILIGIIIASCFLFLLITADMYVKCQNNKRIKETLKYTLHENESFCHVAKQKDGRFTTQLHLTVNISNTTANPISIVKTRLIKPSGNGKVLHAKVLLPMKGSSYHSDEHKIPANDTVKASVDITVEGALAEKGENLKFTVGITNQLGIEHRIKGIIKSV